MNKPFDVSQLRDIHLPSDIAWWPMGWGWWILLWLTSITILAFVIWYYQHRLYRTQRFALKQLHIIRTSECPPHERIKALSILLRRIALSYFPQHRVAGLHGAKWLAFLAQTANLPEMNSKTTQLLIQAPYQSDLDCDLEPVFDLTSRWIKHITKRAPTNV